MIRPRVALLAGIGVLALGTTGWLLPHRHPAPRPIASRPAPTIAPLPRASAELERVAAAVEADPKAVPKAVRARAVRARMTLAYADAKAGKWNLARAGFERARVASAGLDAMSPAWGTAGDQAAYQSLVCLQHEDEKAAQEGFRKFIEERPESPLVHAAHRRLARLNGGAADPNDDELLQRAIAKQEARIRFETSVCGPKAASEWLRRLGKDVSYRTLARACGTTDSGTTMEGLRRGLKPYGLDLAGFELNRLDLARLPLPALLLETDHYVLLLEVRSRSVVVWDPRFSAESERAIPPIEDRDFRAAVLATSPPRNADLTAGPAPKRPELPKVAPPLAPGAGSLRTPWKPPVEDAPKSTPSTSLPTAARPTQAPNAR